MAPIRNGGMLTATQSATPDATPDVQAPSLAGPAIRDSLPDVDTTIDPSQFASGDPVQAQIATLEPPEDIDAANIGQYTPYDAVMGSVNPESTVEGRLTGLLSQQSPYMQRARQAATEASNRRGLLNTSMAVGAAQGAAIDRALPIAQQDAAAFLEQQFRNQGYSNDAARYLAEQSVQRENMQAGLEQQTREFNAQRQFEADRINQATAQDVYNTYAGEQNRNNFATLNADLTAQIRGIDNELAMRLETLTREYSIIENLDSVNGQIYQQMVADMGAIIANEKDPDKARVKINMLMQAAGVEFAFSTGQQVGGGGGGLSPLSAPPPSPKRNVRTNTDGGLGPNRPADYQGPGGAGGGAPGGDSY